MPYITCTRKKSHHKVNVAMCERCKGMKCPDYRDYIQPPLFPGLFTRKPLSKPPRQKRIKSKLTPLPNSPEQLSFVKESGEGQPAL